MHDQHLENVISGYRYLLLFYCRHVHLVLPGSPADNPPLLLAADFTAIRTKSSYSRPDSEYHTVTVSQQSEHTWIESERSVHTRAALACFVEPSRNVQLSIILLLIGRMSSLLSRTARKFTSSRFTMQLLTEVMDVFAAVYSDRVITIRVG